MAKTVLITGANRGIGLEFVKHYSAEGWNVIAVVRNVAIAEEMKSLSLWKVLTLDVSCEPSIHALAYTLDATPIDLLVNNAGICTRHNLEETTKEDLLHQFTVNVIGPFLLTRALLPNLKLAAQASGQAWVVQLSSMAGSISDNHSSGIYGYRMSKAALNMLSVNLALDLKPDKVGVLVLHPGYVTTRMTNNKGTIGPAESVANMTKVIASATLGDSGRFMHAEGHTLQW